MPPRKMRVLIEQAANARRGARCLPIDDRRVEYSGTAPPNIECCLKGRLLLKPSLYEDVGQRQLFSCTLCDIGAVQVGAPY